MNDPQIQLADTERRIAMARRVVGRQREIVAALKVDGHPFADAEDALALFIDALDAFECYERLLRSEVERTDYAGRIRS